MAEREPRSIHMSRDWSDLPSEILDLCCSRMDMMSIVRLAACLRDMHTAIVEARPELFKTPCLLLSALGRCAHHDTEVYIMPLDFNQNTIARNFLAGMYWVGMNSHWMAAVREDRNKLVLVNFHTSHEIILPTFEYVEFYRRGPSHLDYHVSWTDLVLQKIVICQVPTRYADYADFKLIALFDRGLAYLSAGAFFRWRQLTSQWIIKSDTHFCDAIEHNGIIYAIDKADGITYCWDGALSLQLLPFVITPPLPKIGKHNWFLARSDDGKRLMIIHTHEPAKLYCKTPTVYKHREIRECADSGCYVYEQDTSLLGPSGFLSWRRVNSLSSHSLFLGLNYPINQEITVRKDLDGREALFARENCVYTASPRTSGANSPDCQRYSLEPKEGENDKGIWIDFDPWMSQVRQAVMWFKPSG